MIIRKRVKNRLEMSRVGSSLIQKWCRQQGFVNREIFRNKSSLLYWITDEHLKTQAGTQPHIMVSWANLAKKEYSIILKMQIQIFIPTISRYKIVSDSPEPRQKVLECSYDLSLDESFYWNRRHKKEF